MDNNDRFKRDDRDLLIELLTKMSSFEPVVKGLEGNIKSLEDKFDQALKDFQKELDAKYASKDELKHLVKSLEELEKKTATKEEVKNVEAKTGFWSKVVMGAVALVLVAFMGKVILGVMPGANVETPPVHISTGH